MAFNPRALSLAVVAASLVGCGGGLTTGTATVPDMSTSTIPNPIASGDPYNSSQYPTPGNPPSTASIPTPVPVPTVPVATDSPAPVATDSPDPGASPVASPAPSALPSLPPVSTTGLRIVSVTPGVKWGWLGPLDEKAEITSISVQNPILNATQTGRLVVTFLLNGAIVEQPLSIALSVPPGGIWTNSAPFEATVHSDTANAQVITDGQ